MKRPYIRFIDRNNSDKRKKKIVHPFDGRGMPLDYKILNEGAKELSHKFRRTKFDYVIGFAEGGLIPAFSIAQSLKKPLICSYRVRMHLPNEISFSEPHSAIPDHYIYGLKRGDRVLIIEDEITTGTTIVNAMVSLREKGVDVVGVGAFILNKLNGKGYNQIRKDVGKFFYLFKVK